MNVTVIVAPPFEPVTVGDAFLQLRLGDPKADDLEAHPLYSQILRNVTTARMEVEAMTRRSLVQQTLRANYCGFPAAGRGLELRRPPLIRVESVQYHDADNALQTVDAADWYVTDDHAPRILFTDGWASPTSVYSRSDAIRVDYVAGYAPAGSPVVTQEEFAANVPSPLKDAILIGVEILQGAMSPTDRAALELAREAIVSAYRIHTV